MDSLLQSIRGIINQLDPLNTGNKIVFYVWLVVYIFTTIAVWRSQKPWARLICLILNQVFSIGFILSWTLAIIIAVDQWKAALVVAIATLIVSLVLFRRRDPDASKRSLSGSDLVNLHRQWMPNEPEAIQSTRPLEAPVAQPPRELPVRPRPPSGPIPPRGPVLPSGPVTPSGPRQGLIPSRPLAQGPLPPQPPRKR